MSETKQEEMDFQTSIQPTDDFNQLNLPNTKEALRIIDNFDGDPAIMEFVIEHTNKIKIGDKIYDRIPDPDRKRKLVPPAAPIVMYCNEKYYLINSAKLQSVRDLTLIVGILPSTGKQLLENSKTKVEE